MILAKLSTAKTIVFGPVLDADGAEYTSAVVAEVKISKNNGTPAALDALATLTHKEVGVYELALTANDISAVGLLTVTLSKTTYVAPPIYINVLPACVYDSLVAGTDNLQVDTIQVGGTTQTARDLGAGVKLGNEAHGGAAATLQMASSTLGATTMINASGVGLTITGSATGLVVTGTANRGVQIQGHTVGLIIDGEAGGGVFISGTTSGLTVYANAGPALYVYGYVTANDESNDIELGTNTYQEVRDAMKLAPTAGDPAAGSVDKHLDDLSEPNTYNIDANVTIITSG